MYLNRIKKLSLIKKTIIFLTVIIILTITISYKSNVKKANVKQNKNSSLNIETSYNNVFLGDSITALYDLEKYYPNVNVVNSGGHGNTADTILVEIEERVFQYNPSKVFLLIGTNDVQLVDSDVHILNRIEMIIDSIKSHRPYTKIYIESIYPVNNRADLYDQINPQSVGYRNNKRIVSLNKKIKTLCKKENITYIDVFSKLVDESGDLKIEYTKEGLHLTDEAYEIVTKELIKYLEPEEQEQLKKAAKSHF